MIVSSRREIGNFVEKEKVSSRGVLCCSAFFALLLLIFSCSASVLGQNRYEDRLVSDITVTFEGNDRDESAAEQLRLIARNAVGETYSAVRIRSALQALFDTGRIASARVEATAVGEDNVLLRFIIKRKAQVRRVNVVIGNMVGEPVTEEDILFRLNLVAPGTAITDQVLAENANLILTYLRDRGYFNAEVNPVYRPISAESDNEVGVTFNVIPGAQARVREFRINIDGFNASRVRQKLELQPAEPFKQEDVGEDLEKIRNALRDENFLAPELDSNVVFDRESNTVTIEVTGRAGPVVNVSVQARGERVGEGTQNRLLPIKREGTLDFAAIEEGARRLETYFQENGYFFADVTPVCSVEPQFGENEASYIENETELLCSALSGADLTKRVVEVTYRADLDRQLKLVDIRIEGTNLLPVEEIQTVLKTQEANVFKIIPFLGYGRGYTSQELLAEDVATIRSLMRELGYRDAEVSVRQGVAPNGEDLIITFVVEEGKPTRIDEVEIEGNTAVSDSALLAQLPALVGKNYSRARIRNGMRRLAEYYSREGFFDARVNFSIVELGENDEEERIKIVYNVENEGTRVYINRILVNGNEMTDPGAILRTVTLRPGELLRSSDLFTSEQNLYATDAFQRVEIKPEPAGERPDGARLVDVIVHVEEQAPRIMTYGGGFSTDAGPFGFFDIRHQNFFGRLQQAGARVRMSRLQQLIQLDYVNPRFLRDNRNRDGTIRYSPLTVTAQYQRDSTVTRFFRSAFDQGTFGIVQRVDDDGNPIDEFGRRTGDPTINRLTLMAETSRTISVRDRSILFARYRFEDVRLYNIESLLIRDLLTPDAKIRISGFGATFVRDTRENCHVRYSLLEIIDRGEVTEPCRYNPGDPTRGDYLTAEYNVSVPVLGANIGFHKFQASYYRFYTPGFLRNTTFAGRAILGLGSVFANGDRFSASQFPGLEGILPISERFFAGGSTTLRGFDFESAGPRVVIVPQGTFRNAQGETVTLNPFTVPFGGNALAIVNLEARIPLTDAFRLVPFYDGGNVFRRIGDIFKSPDVPESDVFRQNLRSIWSHTVGLGLRIRVPLGGSLGVDFGYLVNPPRFLIPQPGNQPNAIYQVRRTQLHFRFTQAF